MSGPLLNTILLYGHQLTFTILMLLKVSRDVLPNACLDCLCPYGVRLQRLNIQRLELRRLHSDLIWCYKIIFGLVDTDSCDFFTPCTVVSTRGHRYKLYKKLTTGVRSNFFCESH